MPTYKEENFEDHIEAHLNRSGYRSRQPAIYNRSLCLIPDETLRFIQETQPEVYRTLERQYGEETRVKLLNRVSKEIERRGVLDVLRKGVIDRGCRFNLTYFRPSSGMNPDHRRLYAQNRFSLVRQLKYSQRKRKISRYGVVPQRAAVGDNGTEKQPHRSDGNRCRKAVPGGSRSERAVVPIQAVSRSLCSG